MWGTTDATSQDAYQILILVVAIICIPVMLMVKPYHLISKANKNKQKGRPTKTISDDLEGQFQ